MHNLNFSPIIVAALLLSACIESNPSQQLIDKIRGDESYTYVKNLALDIVKTGFNAGDGYGEVWIRDYNTFIELSCKVYSTEMIEENLLVFFRLQGEDGNIIDGFIPKEKAVQSEGGYQYIYSDLEPTYCGHKNTVETDHESSLVQAVYKYVVKTGNSEFLKLEMKPLRNEWKSQWNFF